VHFSRFSSRNLAAALESGLSGNFLGCTLFLECHDNKAGASRVWEIAVDYWWIAAAIYA
jgi:hypothetical protein